MDRHLVCKNFDGFVFRSGQERNLRVPKMVQGDFPLSIYHLNKEGVTSLQVVLTVISFTYPQISYCPLLAPIASLCLHWMTEEETYAALCDLILKEFNEAYMMYLPTNTVSYTALCNSLLPLAIASDVSNEPSHLYTCERKCLVIRK